MTRPNEPSILDYLKSKIAPWKYPRIEIPEQIDPEIPISDQSINEHTNSQLETGQLDYPVPPEKQEVISDQEIVKTGISIPWFSIFALGLAIIAQLSLEPNPNRTWLPGLILFLIAIILVVFAQIRGEWELPAYHQVNFITETLSVRIYPLIAGLLLAIISFVTFSGNRINFINLSLLLSSLGLLIWAFWVSKKNQNLTNPSLREKFSKNHWMLKISRWTIIVIGAFLLAAFFRFYLLRQIPPEMNSDHAEKILDILRILDGQTMIFFPTNGGREALQFYIVAGLNKLFNVELNFMALKSVTALIGFFSLPFIYLLGKELFNRRVGLIALLFAGIAYWPNVVSRVGMRLPFYIFFTSLVLYLLLKALRTGNRNYFILTGLSLGLSFYGYSANRILPILVIIAITLFLIHERSSEHRKQVIIYSAILVIFALVVFLPLLRYMLEDPSSFLFRTLSRMSTAERPLPEPAWNIFRNNFLRAIVMFSWDNGEVWPVSVPHRPALDIVTGALFWLGLFSIFLRYIRKLNWLDLLLILSIPILLLPSVLSLAFPAENPNLYRTGGVIIPVFLIIGMAIDGLISSFSIRLGTLGAKIGWTIAIILITLSGIFSYRLVFTKYNTQYKLSSWNSTEMGQVVRDFSETFGQVENVWIMAYPHWVDSRLVAAISGYPGRDYVLYPELINNMPENTGAKLFLIKPEDKNSITILTEKFPEGWLKEYISQVETKNFLMYIVPPSNIQ